MNRFTHRILRHCKLRRIWRKPALCSSLWTADDAATAVEYAVMLSLIVVVCLTAIRSVGSNAKTTFSNVANSIAGTSS